MTMTHVALANRIKYSQIVQKGIYRNGNDSRETNKSRESCTFRNSSKCVRIDTALSNKYTCSAKVAIHPVNSYHI